MSLTKFVATDTSKLVKSLMQKTLDTATDDFADMRHDGATDQDLLDTAQAIQALRLALDSWHEIQPYVE